MLARSPLRSPLAAALLGGVAQAALASSVSAAGVGLVALPASLQACAGLQADAERLACFDNAVAPSTRGAAEGTGNAPGGLPAGTTAGAGAPRPSAEPPAAAGLTTSFLDEFWELSAERKRGVFNFTGYRPNYFFPVHVTSRVNRRPASPADGHGGLLPD